MEDATLSTLFWTALVAVGYPVTVVALLETRRMLKLRLPAAASICTLIQVTILPLAAVYLLLTRVAGYAGDVTAPKLLLSLLVIATINAFLAAINSAFRSGVFQSEWARRVPALVLDLLRLLIVLMAAAFVASSIWEVDLGSLLAALGVGSVVIGLALQDTLSGLFAGVSLMSGRHFKEGDWIESGDVAGKIVQMDWRSITVETLDDNHLVVIPNSELAKAQFKVINTTIRPFGQSVRIRFSYATPPARAIAAIRRAIEAVDLIVDEPDPGIDLVEMSDGGIEFEVTFHALTREDGDDGLTQFYRKLWYICQRDEISFAGAVNRKYRTGAVPQPAGDKVRQILSDTGIFPDSAKGFDALAAGARFELYDDEEVLLSADAPFDKLFLVLGGGLTASIANAGEEGEVVQAVGAGEFFVNRAYLTAGAVGLDLRAVGETSTLAISASHVLDFLNRNPALARRFEEAIDITERALSAMILHDEI